ncbi:MAG: DNA polymerase Y family protein, partial [Candidatus Sericytochromatia bacterium]|nr:DNA polymerase Y family protein [Candidatus Sericytochromatia bacterium]
RHDPDGWMLRDFADGPVSRLTGPFVLSGGWWHTEIQRDYYLAEMARGPLLWVFYDRRRRRWYLQGEIG